jgi:hypothetical protein
MFPPFLISLGLKLSPVGKALRPVGRLLKRVLTYRLPAPPVWLVVALLAAGAIWHGNKVDAAFYAGELQERTAWEAKAAKWVNRITAINSAIRSKTDEKSRAIAGIADDLRVRGPGKAICTSIPSAPARRHDAPAGTADAAVGEVPDRERFDLIALPFADAIAFAEQHDINLAEAAAWRESRAAQENAWKEQN